MPESTEDSGGFVKPFADIVVALNRGRTHTELSTALQELVAAVQDTGKKGALTFKIQISPTKAEGQLEVADTITVTSPKRDRSASLFYADDDNNLVRDDPRQMSLPSVDITSDGRANRKAN